MPDLQSLRYVGDGAFRPGLPMRDIDHAELAHFDAAKISAAIAVGIYQPIFEEDAAAPSAAPTKAQLREQAAARGLALPARATNAQLAQAIADFDNAQRIVEPEDPAIAFPEAAATPDEQPAGEDAVAAAPEGEQ